MVSKFIDNRTIVKLHPATGRGTLVRTQVWEHGLVQLYICYGTFPAPWRPGGHPCRNAYNALKAAGHEPELVRSYGFAPLPRWLNATAGRREVEALTGNRWVPTLVLDDDTVIDGSREIVEWARANPAGASPGSP